MAIRIVLALMVMANWLACIVGVEGAFLAERLKGGGRASMGAPEGYRKYYPPFFLLQLQRALYGLAQAAMAFFREATQAERSGHPCFMLHPEICCLLAKCHSLFLSRCHE